MGLVSAGWELVALQRQLDELFSLLAPTGEGQPSTWDPPVDLLELEDRFVARLDVPGVERASLHVTVRRKVLRVTGAKLPHKARASRTRCHHAERAHGAFSVEVRLPSPVLPREARATLSSGVLEVTLPRCGDEDESFAIPVEERGR
jgi:HSP20 family molecular chaperone IbpA